MPLKVTPMVCTFNLCSPPTKIKKSRFSVKQVKNRTGSTILRGKTARFTFFLITQKVTDQILNMNQQNNGPDPLQQPGTTILTAAF